MAVALTLVCPCEFVTAGALSVALGPEPGALKVTVAPGTGLLFTSVTVTTRGLANCAPVMVLCPEPLVGLIVPTAVKVATTEALPFDKETVHGPVPEHPPPDQPVK